MDIADPDELVTFAVDPKSGAKSFYTDYNNPTSSSGRTRPSTTFDTGERQELYTKIQAQAAKDAFMVFLYYSPYRVRVHRQGARLLRLPDRELPHGGRLALAVAGV